MKHIISTDILRKYIDTKAERCIAVIKAKSGHTRFSHYIFIVCRHSLMIIKNLNVFVPYLMSASS